jgi:integrase
LREWWKAARPQGWLFPGRDPVQPMTTRQLNRACHAAAQLAEIDKRVSLHTRRLESWNVTAGPIQRGHQVMSDCSPLHRIS